MNKSLKRKWIQNLRSGKYKQGTSCLRSEANNFCCLGVLCDTVEPKRWVYPPAPGRHYLWVYPPAPGRHYLWGSGMGHWTDTLPIKTLRAIHLSHEQQSTLIALNDTSRKNFNEIADWIEANIPEDGQ
jgi:CubicO group peptidase (beta-lactamase class C family)